MFKVINLRTNMFWPDVTTGEDCIFTDGKLAAVAAKNLNEFVREDYSWYTPGAHNLNTHGGRELMRKIMHGQQDVHGDDKWQVRTAVEDDNWRDREKTRIESNHYLPVPWASDKAWLEWVAQQPQADHFVHVSKSNKDMISYTPDEKSGRVDRQIKTTPARYFTKYYAGDEKTLKAWLNSWAKKHSGVDVKFATTREEIRHVYEKGPDSCMKGEPGRFFKHKGMPHPVEAYAAGDLAVAYMERKGKITARGIIWPAKKVYGRMYGDDSALLTQILEADDFKSGSMDGAKMLLIDISEELKSPFVYLMPYLDIPAQLIKVSKDGSHLIIVEKQSKDEETFAGAVTRGYVHIPRPYVSDYSGKTFKPSLDSPVTVYISERKTQTWSTSEARAYGYSCLIKHAWYSKKDCPSQVVMWDDGSLGNISPFAGKKHKIVMCEFYHVPILKEHAHDVIVGYDTNGKAIIALWSYHARRYNGFNCEYSGESTAYWCRSRFPFYGNRAAHNEHVSNRINYIKIKQAKYPEIVNRENADRLLRQIVINNETGKWVVVNDINTPLKDGEELDDPVSKSMKIKKKTVESIEELAQMVGDRAAANPFLTGVASGGGGGGMRAINPLYVGDMTIASLRTRYQNMMEVNVTATETAEAVPTPTPWPSPAGLRRSSPIEDFVIRYDALAFNAPGEDLPIEPVGPETFNEIDEE